jgi:peptidoglycan/LPS O-acetylase OafA/YrhL
MIQRVQTVWLLLAAACGFTMTKAPLFEANLPNNIIQTIIATDSLFLYVLIIATAILALGCIFLFKKRTLQSKLTILAFLLCLLIVVLEVLKVNSFQKTQILVKGSYQWGALLPIFMMVFLIMATRGIYKDEKLVKSLDRLR